jgi:hypothetical protein
MSRFNHPLPFSPLYDFQVLRVVTINGRQYKPGDRLDKANLAERRLRQMYENRVVSPIPPEVVPALLQAPRRAAEPVADEPAGQEIDPDNGEDVQSAADTGKTAVHRGFGRWYVVHADGTEDGPMTKAEAEAAAAA